MLTIHDIKRIERTLKLRVPRAYSILLSSEIDECVDEISLLRSPKQIIATNLQCRDFEVDEAAWPRKYFVIGKDGCGNFYVLDSSKSDGAVLMYDHEQDAFIRYASSLKKFIASFVLSAEKESREAAAFSLPRSNFKPPKSSVAVQLMQAIQTNKKALLKKLLKERNNSNIILDEKCGCSPPMTILIYAIQLNRVDLIDVLIAAGADPTKSGSNHRATPLHHAVKYCGTAVLLKLLEAGANPNRRFRGESATHLAVNLPTMRNWNCLSKWLQKNGLELAPISR
jgi:hypothetical protein